MVIVNCGKNIVTVLRSFDFLDKIASSADSDQTAPLKEQSDQGLHCLIIHFCPNIFGVCWTYHLYKVLRCVSVIIGFQAVEYIWIMISPENIQNI